MAAVVALFTYIYEYVYRNKLKMAQNTKSFLRVSFISYGRQQTKPYIMLGGAAADAANNNNNGG